MPTQVENPFSTQSTQSPQAGIVSSAMAQPSGYEAQKRTVNSNQTVAGQVESILDKGGPLMARTRALAREDMNRRGLVNSTMAIQAEQAALYDRALPMAQQDAQTYANADSQDVDSINRAREFGANASNQFGLQGNDQRFQSTERATDRSFTTSERVAGEKFQTGERRGAEQFQAGENTAQRQFQTAERVGGEKFQGSQNAAQLSEQRRQFDLQQQNEFKRQAVDNAAQLERLNATNKLNLSNVPSNFAAGVSQTTLEKVNTILADPNLSSEAKKAAVDNAINYANATIAWAEKFYKVSLPDLTAPAYVGAAPSPPPPSPFDAFPKNPNTTGPKHGESTGGDSTGGDSGDGTSGIGGVSAGDA
jgi:hypothetical protein